MKAAIKFIKTTVLGGVVVIIPIAVIVIVLGDFYHTLIEITSPYALIALTDHEFFKNIS